MERGGTGQVSLKLDTRGGRGKRGTARGQVRARAERGEAGRDRESGKRGGARHGVLHTLSTVRGRPDLDIMTLTRRVEHT